MSQHLYVIIDSSGSMYEEGKRAASIYIAKSIAGFTKSHYPSTESAVLSWSNAIEKFPGASLSKRKPDFGPLVSFVKEHTDSHIILLTDGSFEKNDQDALAQLASHKSLSVVLMGADANDIFVKQALGKERVYAAVDGLMCVHDLFLNNYQQSPSYGY